MIISKKNIKKFFFSKKNLIPKFIIHFYRNYKLRTWVIKDFLSPFKTPTFVKQKILLKHAVKNTTWIETGTYIGTTTGFLAKRFPYIHTIEPSEDCLKISKSNLARFKNIVYHLGTSEQKLDNILSNLSGNLCLWLDGHFSGGITFLGDKECPINFELKTINKYKNKFDKLVIFIDDISSGFTDPENYPSIDFYVDWARKNNFNWFIEQGIFIIKSENLNIF